MIRQTSTSIQFQDDSYFHLMWDDASRLIQIEWLKCAPPQPSVANPLPDRIAATLNELREYFLHGSPMTLQSDLLDLKNLTEFQKSVYRAVASIPHGETRTYSWVAVRVGKPMAARAVGQALRRNPFPVVIPCHRVVSGKNLGGFMGTNDPAQGEMILKRHLIEAEKNYINPMFSFISAQAGLSQ